MSKTESKKPVEKSKKIEQPKYKLVIFTDQDRRHEFSIPIQNAIKGREEIIRIFGNSFTKKLEESFEEGIKEISGRTDDQTMFIFLGHGLRVERSAYKGGGTHHQLDDLETENTLNELPQNLGHEINIVFLFSCFGGTAALSGELSDKILSFLQLQMLMKHH